MRCVTSAGTENAVGFDGAQSQESAMPSASAIGAVDNVPPAAVELIVAKAAPDHHEAREPRAGVIVSRGWDADERRRRPRIRASGCIGPPVATASNP